MPQKEYFDLAKNSKILACNWNEIVAFQFKLFGQMIFHRCKFAPAQYITKVLRNMAILNFASFAILQIGERRMRRPKLLKLAMKHLSYFHFMLGKGDLLSTACVLFAIL